MCLVDAVTEWNDRSIRCSTGTHLDPTNPLRRNSALSALHAFEYGAQAAAIHGALRARLAGESLPPSYLAALRDAHLRVARLDRLKAQLQIDANRLFGDGGNTVYECQISAAGSLLAEARITIMLQP